MLYVVNEKSGITSALYVFTSMIYCLEKKHPSDLDSRVSMSKYTISWDLISSSSWETVDFLIVLAKLTDIDFRSRNTSTGYVKIVLFLD